MKSFLFVILSLVISFSTWAIIFYPYKIASISMNPSGNDYLESWIKVTSFESQGLTESAKNEVKSIYERAKKEANQPQIVKALLHIYKYSQANEEDDDIKLIEGLKAEIDNAGQPLKSVLHSIMGEIYFNYFNQNRYTIIQRTAIQAVENDFRTWDTQKLMATARDHYLASVKETNLLKNISIEDFSPILTDAADSRVYRATVYDFLIHRAIVFFGNGIADITKAADQFVLDDDVVFKSSQDFAHHQFKNKDSLSLNYYAIQLLQDLESWHQQSRHTESRIDVQLLRLNTVYASSVSAHKEKLYLQALRDLTAEATEYSIFPRIAYSTASHLYQHQSPSITPYRKGGRLQESGDTRDPADIKEALSLCDKAISLYPDLPATGNCRNLREQILAPELQLSCEEAAIPSHPILGKLRYRNASKVFMTIHKSNWIEYMDIRNEYREPKLTYQWVTKQPLINKFTAALPASEDHLSHHTEINIPALDKGFYILVVSLSENINENNIVHLLPIQVSDLALSFQQENGANNGFVRHRSDGQAIKGADITWYSIDYQSRKYSQNLHQFEKVSSDSEGYFKMENRPQNFYNCLAKIVKGDDVYYQPQGLGQGYNQPYHNQMITYFFSDRSIYRPGQKIYFKGITAMQDNRDLNLLSNKEVSVILRDANYQELENKSFITNAFGSFSGEFELPVGLLTGTFTLYCESGQHSFQVEEYKRPKFKVEVNKPEAEIKTDEMVEVEGQALSFAGLPITDSKVSYRVVRNGRFPYLPWYCYYYFWQPPSNEMEITQGETITDADGKYKLSFKAIPDLSLDKKWNPVFDYRVIVDVTDINGETRSSEVIVSAGYASMYLEASVPSQVWVDKGLDVHLAAKTANGFPVEALCKVELIELMAPMKTYRQRLWRFPDTLTMACSEYEAAFPQYACMDNTNPIEWNRGNTIITKEILTGKDKDSLHLDLQKNVKPGKYLLKVTTKDKSANLLEEWRITEIMNLGNAPKNGLEWLYVNKVANSNNRTIKHLIGSPLHIYVLWQVQTGNTVVKREWIALDKEQKILEYKVSDEFTGPIYFSYQAIYANQFLSIPLSETVFPEPDGLEIEVMSFREKILPGEEERWMVKIKNTKGTPILAEMLSTMYDASLDQFLPHQWNSILKPQQYMPNLLYPQGGGFGLAQFHSLAEWRQKSSPYFSQRYDALNWFGFYPFARNYGYPMDMRKRQAMRNGDEAVMIETITMPATMAKTDNSVMSGAAAEIDDAVSSEAVPAESMAQNLATAVPSPPKGSIRTNLSETAFFFPQILTDKDGNITIIFKAPEALTTWKWMGFAHDKELRNTLFSKEIITQKELMVFPNMPRFFRESDEIIFSSKVSNLSDRELEATVKLEIIDPVSGENINEKFDNLDFKESIVLARAANKTCDWRLKIPFGVDMVTCRVIAQSCAMSDGEEHTLPILSNRMLVTETLPLPVRGKGEKSFTFHKLKDNKSATLKHHALTVEFTPNPVWYAIQALPYLMEYPFECNEQRFNRYYANSISVHLANSSPEVEKTFNSWKQGSAADKDALISNLEKNEELKNILLTESPWVREAKDETERKKRLAFLFDKGRMEKEAAADRQKLFERQFANGAWGWFEGMYPDRYITQYIVCGFGRLQNLGVFDVMNDVNLASGITKALVYLDAEMRKDYDEILRPKNNKNENNLSHFIIHYLYTRSFFKSAAMNPQQREAYDYFLGQAEKYWLSQSRYAQALAALALYREGLGDTAAKIMRSLKENATYNDEMGMYYKDFTPGYYWYQAPIETQSVILEAFNEVSKDKESVEGLKTWLLKQKQVQDWKTTIATADACYALLATGMDWLSTPQKATITMGGREVNFTERNDELPQAGTGYVKTVIAADEVRESMADIKVSKSGDQVAWGAVYWQYFENLDKITRAESPLKLSRSLYKVVLDKQGEKLIPVEESKLLIGDKIKVVVEITVDRNMEYVHLKDMRAAGLEPLDFISAYHYAHGLGYYQSIRDASMNFFFDHLSKGVYRFEYGLRVFNKGDFSNGISTIQCMYAPEFAGHSEGIRIKVE